MKTFLLSIGLLGVLQAQAQPGLIKSIGETGTATTLVAEPLAPGFILPPSCTDFCAPPSPQIFINDTVVQEATGAAVLKATLSQPSTEVVVASYKTSNGSAMLGQDYKLAKGHLQFNAGETEKSIFVNIVADKKPELKEHFFVELSEPQNATIGRPAGKITINDVPPTAKLQAAELVADLFVVKVMPNPSKHQFTMAVAGVERNAKIELKIMGENGQLLKTIRGTATQNFIFGEDLKPGVYLVEVWNNNQRHTIKIIKH